MARFLLIVVTVAFLAVALLWFGAQPRIRVERSTALGADTLAAVPTDSVRMLSSYGGDGCAPVRELARLFVDGRLFSPSNAAVHRALRRAAGRIGANAIAFTTPSMDDRLVPGFFDRLWDDDDAGGAMEYTAQRAGHAVALRCAGHMQRSLNGKSAR